MMHVYKCTGFIDMLQYFLYEQFIVYNKINRPELKILIQNFLIKIPNDNKKIKKKQVK